MQGDDVLNAVGAGELEGALQPFGYAEVGGDSPRLVDRDDDLRPVALAGLRGALSLHDDALQPRGGAGHQDAQRRGVLHGAQVEDDQGRVQVEAGRGPPVEHAAQVSLAESLQREGDAPRRLREGVQLHDQLGGHLGHRVKERVDHFGQRRLLALLGRDDLERDPQARVSSGVSSRRSAAAATDRSRLI